MSPRAIAAFLFGLVLCCGRKRADEGAVRRTLVGTWKLVSAEEMLQDGRTRPYPDLGANARGYCEFERRRRTRRRCREDERGVGYPNYLGTTQKRPYRLEGDRLIFSDVESGGEVKRWTLVWRKAHG